MGSTQYIYIRPLATTALSGKLLFIVGGSNTTTNYDFRHSWKFATVYGQTDNLVHPFTKARTTRVPGKPCIALNSNLIATLYVPTRKVEFLKFLLWPNR